MSSKHYPLPIRLKIFEFWQRFAGFFQPLSKEDNVICVVYRLIKRYKIKVTLTTVIEFLKPHPDYPSLKSICDFLNEIGVTNYPVKITKTELFKLNKPFIAHLNISKGRIILVHSTSEEFIIYSDSFFGKKQITTEHFIEKWSGVVILPEPGESSGEKNYKIKKAEEVIDKSFVPIAISSLCLALVHGISSNELRSNLEGITPILFITHTLGLFFSVLLLMNEMSIKTKFSEKICHFSSIIDCDAVTKSKLSNIVGNISWADAGITWFTTGLILLISFPENQPINLLSLLSFLSVLFPIFSLYCQKYVFKKWCPLCISVQVVLIVEFILLLRSFHIKSISLNDLALLLMVLSSIFILEFLIKRYYIIKKEKEHQKIELLKIKRDPELFIAKLKAGNKITLPEIEPTLTFGCPYSNLTVTIFLSFHCSACARLFPEILDFKKSVQNVYFKFVFYPAQDELARKMIRLLKTDRSTIVSSDMLGLIKEWYSTDIKGRSKLMETKFDGLDQDELDNIMQRSKALFDMGNITHVPKVFVNDYELPAIYRLDDIRFQIEGLEKLKYRMNLIEV